MMGKMQCQYICLSLTLLLTITPLVPSASSTPPGPIQLLERNGKDSLRPVDAALKWLNSIAEPIHVVAVVGTFKTGKSFLLNQLIHSKGSGFPIDSSIHPKTKGIWAWGELVEWKGLSQKVLFLDTEGFGAPGNSRTHDATIFAIAYILSSHLIQNSIRVIDQREIEQLELLVRQSHAFGIAIANDPKRLWIAPAPSNSSSNSLASLAKDMMDVQTSMVRPPAFTWVIEDFFLNLDSGGGFLFGSRGTETASEWLEQALEGARPGQEEAGRSLRSIFASTECHTLFLPTLEGPAQLARLDDPSRVLHPAFIEDIERLRSSLLSSLARAETSPTAPMLRGHELAALLALLPHAASAGSLRPIPSLWTAVRQEYFANVSSTVRKYSRRILEDLETAERPIEAKKFRVQVEEVAVAALHLFDKAAVGFSGEFASAQRQEMAEHLRAEKRAAIARNALNVQHFIQEETEKVLSALQNTLEATPLPVRSAEALAGAAAQQETTAANASWLWDTYPGSTAERTAFASAAQLLANAFVDKNRELVRAALEKGRAEGSKAGAKCLEEGRKGGCLSASELVNLEKRCEGLAAETFKQACDWISSEADFVLFLAAVREPQGEAREAAREGNTVCVAQLAEKVVSEALACVAGKTKALRLPMGSTQAVTQRQDIEGSCVYAVDEALASYLELPAVTKHLKRMRQGLAEGREVLTSENEAALKKVIHQPLERALKRLRACNDTFVHAVTAQWRAVALATEEVGEIAPELEPVLRRAIHDLWLQEPETISALQAAHILLSLSSLLWASVTVAFFAGVAGWLFLRPRTV